MFYGTDALFCHPTNHIKALKADYPTVCNRINSPDRNSWAVKVKEPYDARKKSAAGCNADETRKHTGT